MYCYNVSVLNIGLFQFSSQISVTLVSVLFIPPLVNPITNNFLVSESFYLLVYIINELSAECYIIYGTVSAKIAPRLKCYKNASRLNRYNFPTDNAIDFLFSTLHTTPFQYEVLKTGSQ